MKQIDVGVSPPADKSPLTGSSTSVKCMKMSHIVHQSTYAELQEHCIETASIL